MTTTSQDEIAGSVDEDDLPKCPVCGHPDPNGLHVHYKLALNDLINRKLHDARPEAMADTVRRIDTLLQSPVNAYRPLPAALSFHRSRKKYRWCIGGNRSSKSHSVAYEVYWFATGTHPFRKIRTPNTGWYSTITWELVGAIVWKKMKALIAHLEEGVDYQVLWHNRAMEIPKVLKIKVPGGVSEVIFKAYEQGRDAFQGTERRYIANDEQFPQGVYHEEISRIGGTDPLDFFCALTPITAQPWLEERLNRPPADWDVFSYPLDDNRVSQGGFIDDTEIDKLIDEWPEEVQPTRRRGEWASFMGAVYKTYNKKYHVVPLEFETEFLPVIKGRKMIPPGLKSVEGIDFGGANPFVCLWAIFLPEKNAWYVYDEYYWEYYTKGAKLLSQHAKDILERRQAWNATVKNTWADHDVQDRYELESSGVSTSPAFKDVMMGIEKVQTYLKLHNMYVHPFNKMAPGRPRLFIAERCTNLLSELPAYHWPEGTDLHDPRDDPVKVSDHACDALRYIIYSETVGQQNTPRIVLPTKVTQRIFK